MDPDLEIEFEKAEQSIEHDRGLAAHYKASADEKQRLLDLARQEHARADQLQQLLETTQTQNTNLRLENQRLLARIAELEARPTIHAEQLVAEQHVAQQNVINQLVAGNTRKRTSKNKYIDLTNQLTLWTNTTTFS